MRVREIMSDAPATCSPDDSVESVASMMVDNDCGAIPVCEGDLVVGIITDRDIAVRSAAKGIDPKTQRARDVMTAPAVTIAQAEKVDKAIKLMEQKQVRRLAVTDREGRLAGIVAVRDLIEWLPEREVGELLRELCRTAPRVVEPRFSL